MGVQRNRCVNLDWVEIFALEDPILYPLSADFFQAAGWRVKIRDYGTPQYREMFTLLDDGDLPYLEIRRNPYSIKDEGGIFDRRACHIRLPNRLCYDPDPIGHLKMFLDAYRYQFRGISRIDICLDFLHFDTGETIRNFINRYMAGEYSKINQSRMAAHGRDLYDGKDFNSIKWGADSSMVTTKLYNKSMELRAKLTNMKLYILDAWIAAGLISDRADPTEVWRLEFSMNSDCKKWIQSEKGDREDTSDGVYIYNVLETYDSKAKLLGIFHSLKEHYFRFVVYEKGKNKYRCAQKLTFVKNDRETVYQPARLTTDQPENRKEKTILRELSKVARLDGLEPILRLSAELMIEYFTTFVFRDTSKKRTKLLNRFRQLRPEVKAEAVKMMKEAIEEKKQLWQKYLADTKTRINKKGGAVVPPWDSQSNGGKLFEDDFFTMLLDPPPF